MRYAAKMMLAVMLLMFGLLRPMPAVAAIDPETLDIENLPEWRVTSISRGGKLLLSDSPEMVTEDGILYQDKVEGNARLFFYHVNATRIAKQMEVVLEIVIWKELMLRKAPRWSIMEIMVFFIRFSFLRKTVAKSAIISHQWGGLCWCRKD